MTNFKAKQWWRKWLGKKPLESVAHLSQLHLRELL